MKARVQYKSQIKRERATGVKGKDYHQMDGGISDIITELDLKNLMESLDDENEKWENFVDERNDSVSCCVKRCLPEDGGPMKYLSTITFNCCSAEKLRDFYMDRSYMKEWDIDIIDQELLQIDEISGTEIVRVIMSYFYFLPKEYIVAQRLWKGRDGTYYSYAKECEHRLAPRQNKYLRVDLLRCGWRIREVPGTNSCEIKRVHQQKVRYSALVDKAMSSQNMWNSVCKRDIALRKYSESRRLQLISGLNAITRMQKVPLPMDSTSNLTDSERRKPLGTPPKNVIATGLMFLGGVICLAGKGKFVIKLRLNKPPQFHDD